MPIPVTCSGCNRSMKVKDDFEGKKARCPFCQGIVVVPSAEKPRAAASFDVEPMPDYEEERPARRRRDDREDEEPRRRRAERDDYEEEPRRRSKRRDEDYVDEPPRRSRRRDEEYDEDRPLRKKKSTSSGVNGSVLGGLAMMLIAVLWFFGGLAGGFIFFYPPILFIIGVIALIKGLAGRD